MATAAITERRDPSPMIPVAEAARMLGVDEMTIHRKITAEIIPAGRVITGKRCTWRVPRALFTDFIAAVHGGAQVTFDDFAVTWTGPEAVA